MNMRLLSALSLAGTLLVGAGCAREKTGEQLPPLVSTAAVEQYAGESTGARYSASIVPYTEVPLSFKVEGYVTYIRQVRGSDGRLRNVQGGDRVRAGDVLARVRRVDYSHPVEQAQAQVEQTRAQTEQTLAGVGQGQATVQGAQADQRAAESAQNEADAGLQVAHSKLTAAQAQEQQAASALSEAQAGREQAVADLQAAQVSKRQAEAALDQTQQSLRQSRAMLTSRLASEKQTQLTFDRQTNLFKIKSTTKAELDQATASYDVAQAQAEQARAQIGELEAKVRQARDQIEGAQAQIDAAQARIKVNDAKIGQARAQGDAAVAAVRGAKADVSGSEAKLAGAKEHVGAANAAVGAAAAKLTGARADVRGAEAQVRNAQAGLRGKRVPLSDTELRAPIDGVILKRNIEIGSMIQGPSFVSLTSAFTMADTSRVKVIFGVPDVAVGEVRLGAAYTVTSEALPGQRFQGTVTGITPAADPKSRVFQIEITIANPQRKLQSGMIVALEVPGGRLARATNVVPLPAVVRAPGSTDKYAVFVVEESGGKAVARSRGVELGQAFGGNRVQVTGGLRPQDRVIVSGMATLRDGEVIRVAQ